MCLCETPRHKARTWFVFLSDSDTTSIITHGLKIYSGFIWKNLHLTLSLNPLWFILGAEDHIAENVVWCIDHMRQYFLPLCAFEKARIAWRGFWVFYRHEKWISGDRVSRSTKGCSKIFGKNYVFANTKCSRFACPHPVQCALFRSMLIQ